MKAIVYTQHTYPEKFRTTSQRAEMGQNFSGELHDAPDTLQHQERNTTAAERNARPQTLADALLQFIVRRPCTFALVYGSGLAIVALWLFIGSIQNREWIWATIAGSWLLSIVTCVGGINYLLSNRPRTEI